MSRCIFQFSKWQEVLKRANDVKNFKHSLTDRILWVVWARVIFLGVMASSSITLNVFYGDTISQSILWAIFLGLSFSIFSRVFLFFVRNPALVLAIAHSQILVDALLAGYLVGETGGLSSSFTLLFGLNILSGGVILLGQGSLIALFYSFLAFSWVSLQEHGLSLANDIQTVVRFFLINSLLLLVGSVTALLFRNRAQLISSLEKSAAEVKVLSRLQELLIEKIPMGLLFINRHQVQFENPESLRIFSKSFLSQSLKDLPFEIPNHARINEIDFLDRDGRKKSLLLQVIDLEKENRLLIVQDISETRELEKKMRTNEKLASLGEFAAGLAHEIKNPLASVSGSIQMLQGSDSTEDQKFRLMSIIMRETDRLDRLLNDFLNYAKPGQLKLEALSIAEIASEVAALIKNQGQAKEIRFELQMNKNLKIEADPIKIRQLIWNLLKNAVDAIHQRGEVLIRLTDLGEKVRLEIQDSGRGIEKEIQDYVFQPFFTRSQNGTGLGLALVHQVVKEHEGEMGFSSEKNKGTLFWIEFSKKFRTEEKVVA